MAGKVTPALSEKEIEILKLGKSDPSIISNYFFCQAGNDQGWIFDDNFVEEGKWQEMVHKATQARIIVVGGFGSGKTRGLAISACVWALTTIDFMFMNCAPLAWQSELMYNFIVSVSRGTPFERLIYSKPKRPYPKIELRYMVYGVTNICTLEFMSVEKNANTILGWEGDWANIDEAGLLDNLDETITNLGTRLRGKSVVGKRDRLGRMSMITNSWDNPELWYRYDLARELPDDYLSLTVSTRHNKNVTEAQLRMMLKDVPEDEHERFIDGSRPEGKGNYFSKQKVYACEDQTFGDFIIDGTKRDIDGFNVSTAQGCGVIYYTVPPVPKNFYMILADPGAGNAPNRNAPVIMVWDVTDFPRLKASMVAFWWGSGNGSITPFVNQILRFMAMYNPIFTAADSTATQKNTAEVINTYLLSDKIDQDKIDAWLGEGIDFSRVSNPVIEGLGFSGSQKPAYLVSGRFMIEAGMMMWPKFVTGLRSQLTNYEPAKDKTNEPKITQDLVAAFCMSAYAVRVWFNIDPKSSSGNGETNGSKDDDQISTREKRLPREQTERSRNTFGDVPQR